jgi:hypothetical protein
MPRKQGTALCIDTEEVESLAAVWKMEDGGELHLFLDRGRLKLTRCLLRLCIELYQMPTNETLVTP